MKKRCHSYRLICAFILFVLCAAEASGSEIIDFIQQPHGKLEHRIAAALKLALNKFDGKEIWLAYSIDSTISRENFIANKRLSSGSFQHPQNSDSLAKSAMILLDYSLESGFPYLHQIHVNQLPLSTLKSERPVFWLGEQKANESLDWLMKQFALSRYSKLSQQFVDAINFHGCENDVVEFNRAILLSQFSEAIKYEAVKGLGNHESISSIRVLVSIISSDETNNVKKRALAALSQMKNEKAHTNIFDVAKRWKEKALRKEAIFWLAQMATKTAIDVLEEIVRTETDIALKEYAIFAIGQLPKGRGNDILCHIAETNPNARMREKAKFWMGQNQGHRFFELLNDLSDEEADK